MPKDKKDQKFFVRPVTHDGRSNKVTWPEVVKQRNLENNTVAIGTVLYDPKKAVVHIRITAEIPYETHLEIAEAYNLQSVSDQ